MGELRYNPDDLTPILVLETTGDRKYYDQLYSDCHSNSNAYWFNHGRFHAGVLELGGLHALRAIRTWHRIGINQLKELKEKGGIFAFAPETDLGTCPICGLSVYACECPPHTDHPKFIKLGDPVEAPPFHPNCGKDAKGYDDGYGDDDEEDLTRDLTEEEERDLPDFADDDPRSPNYREEGEEDEEEDE